MDDLLNPLSTSKLYFLTSYIVVVDVSSLQGLPHVVSMCLCIYIWCDKKVCVCVSDVFVCVVCQSVCVLVSCFHTFLLLPLDQDVCTILWQYYGVKGWSS